MLRYEIKKVFSKSKNRIAVIVLFVILVITSILTINKVEFVDENGNSSVGISASRDLREAKNQWAGYLTTDTLSKALEENKTINGWNLILVNHDNYIPADYKVQLTELSNGKKVDSRIYPELQEMFDDARAQGYSLFVREGYRTQEEQQQLMDEKIELLLSYYS